jgi:hypothetical protein
MAITAGDTMADTGGDTMASENNFIFLASLLLVYFLNFNNNL